MIDTPTVLILGAGASAPYRFPLGRALITNLLVRMAAPNQAVAEQLIRCGHEFKLIEEFRDALNLSSQPSVDVFLENRPEFLEIGKAAIACELIPFEREYEFRREEGDYRWYEYLWGKIGAPPERFKENRLSVLTFNYDRSLEHFLYLALKNSYELNDAECADLIRSIPIVHLYGQLGELPYLNTAGRPYEPTLSPQVIRQCISTIKIVHEGTANDIEFAKASKLLTDAQHICFLGFGYHSINVGRLELSKLNINKRFFGTALNTTEAERHAIKLQLPRYDQASLGHGGLDVLSYLREIDILR